MKSVSIILAFAFLVATCTHELPFPNQANNPANNPVNSATCSPDTVYFTNTILPLVSSGCAMTGCHDPVTHKEGFVLNNYSGIMQIVKPGNAGESKLYKVITKTDPGDVMPPPPHQRFTAANISAIQKWINQGAKNSQCASSCDTTVFTFSATISPMINTYCKGCHSSTSPGGGIDLSTYANIRQIATDGRFLGSIKHASGYKPMPQGSKLQDCQIVQVEKWIKAGSPNN